jgi:hypothetical protein
VPVRGCHEPRAVLMVVPSVITRSSIPAVQNKCYAIWLRAGTVRAAARRPGAY